MNIKPLRRARGTDLPPGARDHRPPAPRPKPLASTRPPARQPTIAPHDLTDAEIDLLRTIADAPGFYQLHPAPANLAAARRLEAAGAITLEPPAPSPYRSRVPWRASTDWRPWRARPTERARTIVVTERQRIRPLPGDPAFE